jgi:hypothetical protein
MEGYYRGGYHTPDSVYRSQVPGTTVICLNHPVDVSPEDVGGSWLVGCYPTLPAPLRRDLIGAHSGKVVPALFRPKATLLGRQPTRPTRLALSCTLAQPKPLLASLVGSYPTVSALTPTPATLSGADAMAGILSVAVVVKQRILSALTCCFVRQPCQRIRRSPAESREVPLPVCSKAFQQRRLLSAPMYSVCRICNY